MIHRTVAHFAAEVQPANDGRLTGFGPTGFFGRADIQGCSWTEPPA